MLRTDAVNARSWETIRYGIQTKTGHYLTAVGGGGRISDTIHSDATRVGSWEKFQVACNQ